MLFVLLIWTTGVFAQGDGMGKGLDELGKTFDARMKALNVVGGSFCVVRDGKIMYTRHHGYADEEMKRMANNETIYLWGSNTKLFTTIAIMQLRDHGKLSLDDPLVKYIPSFRNVNNPFGNTEKITLRLLMGHSAGLQNGSFPLPLSWHKPWPKWEQLEPLFPYINVEHQPGTKYQYSNLGLLLLGKVIELVTNDDYDVYIDKNILKPLKMYQTYFDTTPYHLLPQKAQGYYVHEEGQPRKLYHPDVDQGVTSSNGGLKSSISDFARFAAFVIGGNDPMYEIVLKRSSLEEMFAEGLPVEDGPGDVVGLGFHKRSKGLQFTLYGHTGNANGFRSEFEYSPQTRTAYFMVVNTYNGEEAFDELRTLMDAKALVNWQK
jgi:CubicO group peptidase (beta-lactamase class C family)